MSFEEFVAARLRTLLQYAVALTGNRELAQDVVQEALARAYLRWRRIGRMDRPELYVRRMITNEFLSIRRRKRFTMVGLIPGPHDRAAPSPPPPKLSTRVVTVAGYHALGPAPTPCVSGGYPKVAELTAAVSGLLAGRAGAMRPDIAATTCVSGTSATFALGVSGQLFVDIGYRKGSFAALRGACRPACGPADAIVKTREQELPGRLKRTVDYEVTVIRPDDRTVSVTVEPDPAGVPRLTIDELVALASGQPLATHATVATSAPGHLSATN
jgi:hypothetical protein